MSFAEWIKDARVTDDPIGDLISDARIDPRLPKEFNSARDLQEYIRWSRPSFDTSRARATVPAAWRRYQAWLKKRNIL